MVNKLYEIMISTFMYLSAQWGSFPSLLVLCKVVVAQLRNILINLYIR